MSFIFISTNVKKARQLIEKERGFEVINFSKLEKATLKRTSILFILLTPSATRTDSDVVRYSEGFYDSKKGSIQVL